MNRNVALNGSPFPPSPPRRGVLSLAEEEEEEDGGELMGAPRWRNNSNYRRPATKRNHRRTGARTAEPRLSAACSLGGVGSGVGTKWGVAAAAGSGDIWPGQGWGRQVVRSGVDAIAGLPLAGDERDEGASKAAAAVEEVWLLKSREQRRRQQRRREPTPVVSRLSAGPTDKTQNERRRQAPPRAGKVVASTHDNGGGGGGGGDERVVASAAPRSTTNDVAVASTVIRKKVANQTTKLSRYSALSLPVSPEGVLAATGAGLTVPQQQETLSSPRLKRSDSSVHQQWGGFGPGHVPKFFRGKFGVAGERKRLMHRQNGDDGVDVT